MIGNSEAGPSRQGDRRLVPAGLTGPWAGGDIAPVLRRRLILICFLLLVPVVIIIVGVHLEQGGYWTLTDDVRSCVAALCLAVPLVVMLRRPGLPLRRLRVLEAVIFGCAAVFLGWGQHQWFHSSWLPVLEEAAVQKKVMELLGDSYCMPWFFLVVFYGTCIPNTGRRCALVVVGMAAAALGLILFLSRHDPNLAPSLYAVTISKTVFWLAMGCGIAVFGSQKMTELRRAAGASKLGQYALKRKLGEGGMGEIYLAEHPMLRRPCAVKIIRPEKTGDPRNLARFAREVQAVTSLTGPNIVDVFDYGQGEDGTFFYVMEFLQGMNLQEMVDRAGPQPPERVVYFLRQVCSALQEAHACGLVHRDVKPGNIFVCRCGTDYDAVKLVDFGLVFGTEEDARLTQVGMVMGSPLFMSPEQITGSVPLDGRSDLYSLGLVAYCVLTGQNPFRRRDVQAVFAAQLTEPAPPLRSQCPSLAADLEAIILRCLEKEREKRFASAAELEAALARCSYAGRWGKERAEEWWLARFPASQSFSLAAPPPHANGS